MFSRVLELAPLRFCGIVSFSMYLWHLPVLFLVNPHLHASVPVKAVVAIIGTLLVSAGSYLAFERPFLKVGSTLVRRSRAEAPLAAAETVRKGDLR